MAENGFFGPFSAVAEQNLPRNKPTTVCFWWRVIVALGGQQQMKGVMSEPLVTTGQTDSVCRMANEKQVGRGTFQQALDDGRVAGFLDGLKIVAPEGARIHILRVKVKLDRPWQEAVDAAGPNTPTDYNVRKVGDLYVPTGTGEEDQEHVLLNYPAGDGNWDKAHAWAKDKGLKKTVPRGVFAIGEHHPTLHSILEVNPMYVVATTECTFEGYRHACYVWWHDSERRASLCWVENFGRASGWFAFRK